MCALAVGELVDGVGATATISASACCDLELVIPCHVWTGTQLSSRMSHVCALQANESPVAAGHAMCARANFCEIVCMVMLATKQYAILCDCFSVFHTS